MTTLVDDREAAFRRVRVEHPAQQRAFAEVWDALEMARHHTSVTLLVGPTGVGKTNLIERIRAKAVEEFRASGDTTGRIPFLSVSAAPPVHDTFRFPGFFRAILRAADDAFANVKVTLPSRTRSDVIQDSVLSMLRNRRPLVFCIDEAQHMTYAARNRKMENHLDLIKWLTNESQIPILMVGTNELLRMPILSDQLGRRTAHVAMNPYRYDAGVKLAAGEVGELQQFIAAARYFRGKLPVPLAFDLSEREHYDMLYEGSCGAIGILKPWLDRALHRCLRAGRRTITVEDFTATRHPYGKLKQIALAITKGREHQRVLDGDLDEVRAELGMPAREKKPRAPRVLKPGQRRLERDPVGLDEDAAA